MRVSPDDSRNRRLLVRMSEMGKASARAEKQLQREAADARAKFEAKTPRG